MRVTVTLLVVLASVAACGIQANRPAFDGQFFRASASKNGDSRAEFAIKVRPVSASFEGAIEAGRYEATRYCVTRFGTSDIVWTIGPDQDPETLAVANDTLNFSGVCNE